MITRINESKILTKHVLYLQANVNVNLMEENVIQNNDEITVNIDVSVKNVMYVKKIIYEIMLHVFVKVDNI